MPLVGPSRQYQETLTITPSTATNVVNTWSIDGGYILSGQGTNSILYKWNPVNGAPVLRTISVLSQNSCSQKTKSKSFTVCDEILGVSIGGPSSVVENTPTFFFLNIQQGYPIEIEWSIVAGNATITGGNGTNQITVVANQPGLFTVSVAFQDCDGNQMTSNIQVEAYSSCIALTSVSF